jgi:hypothetical protein
VKTALRCGISTSFITVIKPHMKKSVVSTAIGHAMRADGAEEEGLSVIGWIPKQ